MPQRESRNGGRIQVFVADNTRMHSQLLAEALRRDDQLEIVGSTSSFREFLQTAATLPLDVAIISSNLDEKPLQGFEALRQLRALKPAARVVMLLDACNPEIVLEAFRSGAKGIFSKEGSLETLCKCVHCVHQGQVWANSQEMSLVLEALSTTPTVRAVNAKGADLLSKRELDVVRLLAEGLSNREIGERLKLSQHTIKNYLFRIFDKLGVSSRLELLFLTLSQPIAPNTSLQGAPFPSQPDNGNFAGSQKAAEEGIVTAQLQMAQSHAEGLGAAKDAVSAYMWFLVVNDHVLRERNRLAKSMTMEEHLEAEQRATAWLQSANKKSPAAESVDSSAPYQAPVRPDDRRPRIVARVSSA
jgi:DNA-binding NarL/FixJ family response regulator